MDHLFSVIVCSQQEMGGNPEARGFHFQALEDILCMGCSHLYKNLGLSLPGFLALPLCIWSLGVSYLIGIFETSPVGGGSALPQAV